MKINWLGHASFLITSENGTRIITDPYETNDKIRYGQINEAADIVTVSHGHSDHNNVATVRGNPQTVRGNAEAKGIRFQSIPAYHDDEDGSKRGGNTIFCFEVDGVSICHLGDLGHLLSDKQISELGQVDVLLIPVGGFFTIDAKMATRLTDQLKPGVIIPMHYKTDKCGLPIATIEEFLQGKDNVKRVNASELELKSAELPASTQIMVLKPAL